MPTCRALYFIAVQVLAVFAERSVDYYVKTIEKGIAKSMKFIGPRDASAHQPTFDGCSDSSKRYDYIIVGGGTAGSVIAARLSEDARNSVLLLEAGGYESVFGNIPRMTAFLQAQEYNWNFNSTPQTTSCLAMINQECAYPRGKGLGGTSLINGLIYARGNKEDYDYWEKLGNYGWGYDDVLPYFQKSENLNVNGDEGYHNVGGPLNVEHHRPNSPQLDAFLEANVQLGHPILDYNGKQQLGASKTQFNYRNGSRASMAKAFLFPAFSRNNLHVLTKSYVTKILVSNLNNEKKAYGVLFTHNGRLIKVSANKEVILSAGVIGSPQLLMLSGIGPKRHLTRLGIPVIKHLPVGENFQDHPGYHALIFSTNYTEPVGSIESHVKEYLQGYGPYAIDANLQGLAFYQSKRNRHFRSENADFEIIIQPSNNTAEILQRINHYNDDAFNTIWRKVNPQSSFTLLCILMHPKSKGSVRLKSANPFEYPLLDTNLLSDRLNEDIEMLYEVIQHALELVNTEAFQKLNASLSYLPLQKCIEDHEYLSKPYWFCQIRQLTFHLYHGSGTCRMGVNSRTSVVNPELKVHGVQNLRVADASVFPTPIAGHNNAPTIMIAEKISDIIKLEQFYSTYRPQHGSTLY